MQRGSAVKPLTLCYLVAQWGVTLRRDPVWRGVIVAAIIIGGFFLYRAFFDPAVDAIESVNPALTGYLGGLDCQLF